MPIFVICFLQSWWIVMVSLIEENSHHIYCNLIMKNEDASLALT